MAAARSSSNSAETETQAYLPDFCATGTVFVVVLVAGVGGEREHVVGEQVALAQLDRDPRPVVLHGELHGPPHRADLEAVYAAKGVPAAQCSTGEQKALLISLILANARALAARDGAPPLLLLDEVAAHLDPDRRAALYDEIVALGAQAWMTGTERTLFSSLGDRAQYFEITEEAGAGGVEPGRA